MLFGLHDALCNQPLRSVRFSNRLKDARLAKSSLQAGKSFQHGTILRLNKKYLWISIGPTRLQKKQFHKLIADCWTSILLFFFVSCCISSYMLSSYWRIKLNTFCPRVVSFVHCTKNESASVSITPKIILYAWIRSTCKRLISKLSIPILVSLSP